MNHAVVLDEELHALDEGQAVWKKNIMEALRRLGKDDTVEWVKDFLIQAETTWCLPKGIPAVDLQKMILTLAAIGLRDVVEDLKKEWMIRDGRAEDDAVTR